MVIIVYRILIERKLTTGNGHFLFLFSNCQQKFRMIQYLMTRLGDSRFMIAIYVLGWFDVIVIYVLDDLIVNDSRE